MRTTLWMAHIASAIALTGGLPIDPPTSAPELHANSSFFLWFLCALGFLKVSQHMDTILSSLGLHVTKTGGSMLEEVVMAGKAVTGLFKSLGGAMSGAGPGRSHGGSGIDGGGGGGDHNPPAGADIGITGIADIPMGPSGAPGPDGVYPAPAGPVGPGDSPSTPNPVSMGRPSAGSVQPADGAVHTEKGKPSSLGDIPKDGKLTGEQAASALTSSLGYGPTVPPSGGGTSQTGTAANAPQTDNPPVWNGPGYPQDVGSGKPSTPEALKTWDGPGYPAEIGTDTPKQVPDWDGPGYPADVGSDIPAPLPDWDGPGYPDDVGSTESLQANPEPQEIPETPHIESGAAAADDAAEPVGEMAPVEDTAPDVSEADLGEGEPIPMAPDAVEDASIPTVPDGGENEPIPADPTIPAQPEGSVPPVSGPDALADLGISLAGASGKTTPQTVAASPETAGPVPVSGTHPVPGEIHPVGTGNPNPVPGTIHGAGIVSGHSMAGAAQSAVAKPAGTSPTPAPSEDTGLPDGITVLGGTPQQMGSSIPVAPTPIETSGAGVPGAISVSPENGGASAVPGESGEGPKIGVPTRPEGSGTAETTRAAVPETTAAHTAPGTSVPSEAPAPSSSGGTASGDPLADLGIAVDPYTPPPPPPPKRIRPHHDRGYWYKPFHNKVPAPYGEDNPEYMASLAAAKAAEAAAAAGGDAAAGSVPTGTGIPSPSETIPTAPNCPSGSGSAAAASGYTAPEPAPPVSSSSSAGYIPSPNTSPDLIPGISIENPAGTDTAVSGDSIPTSIPTSPAARETVPTSPVGSHPAETGANPVSTVPIVSLADGAATASPQQPIPQAPVFRDVEIGGGQITGWETPAGGGMERRFAMYSTEHFEAPKDPYEIVKTADGASWYRQYGRNKGRKLGILPRVPRRKKR